MSLVFGVESFVTASISGVTISDGKTPFNYNGGGIYDGGTLTVSNCTVSGNTAGGSAGGICSAGTLTVTDSTIDGNASQEGDGGGIEVNTDAMATITGCTIQGNSALPSSPGQPSVGGGVANDSGSTMIIIDSIIGGDQAGQANKSVTDGGGVYNGGQCTLLITGSTVEGNMVTGSGGNGGGIQNDTDGKLTVTDSTIAGNSATGLGGGLQSSGTAAIVTNCTIAGNSAEFGGGIETETIVTVFDSTIAYNGTMDSGGGLLVDSGASATLDNTIVAQNSTISVLATSSPTPDDIANEGTLSGSFNLIGDGGSGGLTNINGNQVGVASPGLGPLANNGGPTQTIAFSPAARPSTPAAMHCAVIPAGQPLTTDQRGTGLPADLQRYGRHRRFRAPAGPSSSAVSVAWGTHTAALQTAARRAATCCRPAATPTCPGWASTSCRSPLTSPRHANRRRCHGQSAIGVNYGPSSISGSGTNYTITLAQPIKASRPGHDHHHRANFVTFIRRLDVLPGDFDDNGVVNKRDVKDVRNELQGQTGPCRRSSVTSWAMAQSTPGI